MKLRLAAAAAAILTLASTRALAESQSVEDIVESKAQASGKINWQTVIDAPGQAVSKLADLAHLNLGDRHKLKCQRNDQRARSDECVKWSISVGYQVENRDGAPVERLYDDVSMNHEQSPHLLWSLRRRFF